MHYFPLSCTSSPCNLLFLNPGVYGLVQATVGVGTVLIWDFCVAYTKGEGVVQESLAQKWWSNDVDPEALPLWEMSQVKMSLLMHDFASALEFGGVCWHPDAHTRDGPGRRPPSQCSALPPAHRLSFCVLQEYIQQLEAELSNSTPIFGGDSPAQVTSSVYLGAFRHAENGCAPRARGSTGKGYPGCVNWAFSFVSNRYQFPSNRYQPPSDRCQLPSNRYQLP